MSGGDLGVTRRHIYAKLTAASALSGLTVVEGIADDDAGDTFVSFEYLPEDRPMTMGTGATYIFTRPRYKVVVVGKNVPFSALTCRSWNDWVNAMAMRTDEARSA